MTGLVFTSTDDATPFLERYARGRLTGIDEGEVIEHGPLCLTVTGIGKVKATLHTERLLQRHPIDRVLHVGMSTGLSDAVDAGTLMAARAVLEGDRVALSAPSYPQMPLPTLDGLATGMLVTHDHAVQDDDEGYWQRLADMSDTTGYAVAYVAAQHGIPCYIVKAVTGHLDASPKNFQQTLLAAREALADFILQAIDDRGEAMDD